MSFRRMTSRSDELVGQSFWAWTMQISAAFELKPASSLLWEKNFEQRTLRRSLASQFSTDGHTETRLWWKSRPRRQSSSRRCYWAESRFVPYPNLRHRKRSQRHRVSFTTWNMCMYQADFWECFDLRQPIDTCTLLLCWNLSSEDLSAGDSPRLSMWFRWNAPKRRSNNPKHSEGCIWKRAECRWWVVTTQTDFSEIHTNHCLMSYFPLSINSPLLRGSKSHLVSRRVLSRLVMTSRGSWSLEHWNSMSWSPASSSVGAFGRGAGTMPRLLPGAVLAQTPEMEMLNNGWRSVWIRMFSEMDKNH